MRQTLILTVLATLLLTGCEQGLHDVKDLKKVPGLEDCTYYSLTPGGSTSSIQVVRCPNSSTTTTYASGKTKRNVVVIDGVEYVQRESAQ